MASEAGYLLPPENKDRKALYYKRRLPEEISNERSDEGNTF